MPSPSPKRTPAQLEVVDPRWIAKAFALAIAAAALCAYLAVCLLVYLGSWQSMIYPTARMDRTPADFAIPFVPVQFDAAATGRPRLTAWWIPANTTPAPTILFLHDARGTLSTSLSTLELLHQAGVNIFAIDYRGFGQSEGPHPTEARMNEDTAAALDYLVTTRHIPPAGIVPYGEGVAAVLATNLSNSHPELPAFIVEDPDPDAFSRVIHQDRSRLLPMSLLVRDHFDIAQALAHSTRPKLLLADTPFIFETARVTRNQQLFRTVPDPKLTVTFDRPFQGVNTITVDKAYLNTIGRFLDQYVTAPIPELKGAP